MIGDWIKPGASVLDLGCGDGALLAHLHDHRQTTGYGLEIDQDNITRCLRNGVNVVQYDLDQGLARFNDQSFDYVIMTETLQSVRYPHHLLRDMLRVGREGIVTFSNTGHWRSRLQLLFGHTPHTREQQGSWYENPHIRICSIADFEHLCRLFDIRILQRATVDHPWQTLAPQLFPPNLMWETAIYRLGRVDIPHQQE